MFPERGPSTATSRPSQRDRKLSSCPPAARWVRQTQMSPKHCANHRQCCKAVSTRLTTITSLDLDHDWLTGSRRWRTRCTPTPSEDESSHIPQDNSCMCGV